MNFLAPNLHIVRCFNPELNLSVFVADNGYFDIVTNDDGFVLLACEYEHPASPSVVQEHYARRIGVHPSDNVLEFCRSRLTNRINLMQMPCLLLKDNLTDDQFTKPTV